MSDVLRDLVKRLQAERTPGAFPQSAVASHPELRAVDEIAPVPKPRPDLMGEEQQSTAAMRRRLDAEPSMASLTSALDATGPSVTGVTFGEKLHAVPSEPQLQIDNRRRDEVTQLGEPILHGADERPVPNAERPPVPGDAPAMPAMVVGVQRRAERTELFARDAGPRSIDTSIVDGIAERIQDQLEPRFAELRRQLVRAVHSEGSSRQFRLRANQVE